MKRILLLTTMGVLAGPGLALADCAPDNPGAGDVVFCTGADTDGFSDGSDDLTVYVQDGASVAPAAADTDAVKIKGDGNTLLNSGTIEGSDDAVVAGDDLTLNNDGTIRAADDGVDTEGHDGLSLTNTGLIETPGKAVKAGPDDDDEGGNGLTLVNTAGAVIRSTGNEGIETGNGADITNKGTIEGFDDAIQVGENATIVNSGLIANIQTPGDSDDPQDAIDIDSGYIRNEATGVIRSTVDAAIDFDPGTGTGVIDNFGLISGTVAVETDEAVTQDIAVYNAGTLMSTRDGAADPTGLALQLRAGNDVFVSFEGSSVVGGAEFGAGDDAFDLIGGFSDIFGGAGALFDGGEGQDQFSALDYTFDMLSATLTGSILGLSFENGADSFSVALTGFEIFNFADATYGYDDIAAIAQPAPVPLPAGGVLILSALAGFGLLRRRG
ncbi:VPLPA-CTERM sorting domain-containing protein [Rhodovulum visakhapatnamense]|uniref:Putative secreted protein n=1 Tax=Rhodovulum visakhapatnamense TaxID=364297 RepID=A0A4R8FN35_9RHOB|nr:VPLPA-CTERM sorting domain-containing protein [Rhodovulum visakhapatnamense]TDX27734.1 putative secreted protein [Rhodovulum visakhapatnamense]